MIDLERMRSGIAGVLADADVKATVYTRAIDGTAAFPLVWIGQPEVEMDPAVCELGDVWTVPIAVAVSRTGVSESDTQQSLEALWVDVARALRDEIDGYHLAEVGHARLVKRAEAGSLDVQGTVYPAQVITIEIQG